MLVLKLDTLHKHVYCYKKTFGTFWIGGWGTFLQQRCYVLLKWKRLYGRNAKSIIFLMHFRVHLGAKKILT